MTTIYILKLEHDCYYIGKTNNYSKRIKDHLNNNGALWTRLHKVISEEKIIPNCSPFDEDKYVKEYMAKYGIDKVRGGCYVTEKISEEQYNLLTKEIWAATDVCTRCGRKNHFIKDCYANTDINDYIINEDEENIYYCDICNKEFDNENQCIIHMEKCNILNKKFNTKKSGICHQNLYCKLKPNNSTNDLSNILHKLKKNNHNIYNSYIESLLVYMNWCGDINRTNRINDMIQYYLNLIEKFDIIEKKKLLLYLLKHNDSFDKVIIKYYIKCGIYNILANEKNIKLTILHLIIFHNISIELVLAILLILYDGFDKTNLEQFVIKHTRGPQPLIDNIFENIYKLFINSIETGVFNKHNVNFEYNYEKIFITSNAYNFTSSNKITKKYNCNICNQ